MTPSPTVNTNGDEISVIILVPKIFREIIYMLQRNNYSSVNAAGVVKYKKPSSNKCRPIIRNTTH